jgi:hypothetical protein
VGNGTEDEDERVRESFKPLQPKSTAVRMSWTVYPSARTTQKSCWGVCLSSTSSKNKNKTNETKTQIRNETKRNEEKRREEKRRGEKERRSGDEDKETLGLPLWRSLYPILEDKKVPLELEGMRLNLGVIFDSRKSSMDSCLMGTRRRRVSFQVQTASITDSAGMERGEVSSMTPSVKRDETVLGGQ